MQGEEGFSLAEMLAALFILSALLVSLGQATQLFLAHWQRVDARIASLRALSATSPEALSTERQLKESASSLNDPETGLVEARPRLDHAPDCIFDLVGRRCR